MGGRGAVALKGISVGIGIKAGSGYSRQFTKDEIDAFNKELPENSSNKQVRDLFIKKYGNADIEYGMAYKNGKAVSLSEGDNGSVFIKAKRGESSLHNHPVNTGITGLGFSRQDIEAGFFKGEKETSITTMYKGKVVKQSIKYGENFGKTEKAFLDNTLKRKVLFNEYMFDGKKSINQVQKKLFATQDRWFSNINNQKKYGFSYYSTFVK